MARRALIPATPPTKLAAGRRLQSRLGARPRRNGGQAGSSCGVSCPRSPTHAAGPRPADGVVAFVSTTPESRNRYAPGQATSAPNLNEPNLEPLFAKLKQNPRFDGAALDEFLSMSVSRQVSWPQTVYEGAGEPIRNGLAIRLRLPHS